MRQGEIISFLSNIWNKQCKPGEYVFLSFRDPNKKKGNWIDVPIKYTGRASIRKAVKDLMDQYSPNKYDWYWCPLPFKGSKRNKDLVTRSKFLWQDLDYADPKKFKDQTLYPTIYWESSPGRFHGLWELDNQYEIKEVETLNRDLAYEVDADKGGWDLTQVLRVPGTKNHKYAHKPTVQLRHSHGTPIPFSELRSRIKHVEKQTEIQFESKLDEGDPQEILNRYAGKLPRDLLTVLLQKKAEVGKRSEIIWSLEHRLYEIGLTPDEIFTLIKHSAWNKYRGRHDEDLRLTRELQKIISETVNKSVQEKIKNLSELDLDGIDLVIDSYSDVMGNIRSYPGWLVEGFWARRSHGIVAGEPKVFKSTFTLDLAISVASGQPFLGKYPVLEPGPVLLVQNENADWLMKDKIEKVIANRGLSGKVKKIAERRFEITFPQEIPLYSINQQGYLLNSPEHQVAMEKIIQEMRPVLVIFDPLYLMFDGDINSAKELNPVLNWLLKLKNEYKTGVMLIHHYNKGNGGSSWRGGQRMLGSTTLHGWIESAWYLQANEPEGGNEIAIDKVSDNPVSVIMTREFRTAGHYPKIELKLKMGEFGNPSYEVQADIYREEGKDNQKPKRLTNDKIALEIIRIMETKSVGTIVSWSDLMENIGVDRKNIIKEAGTMAAQTNFSIEITPTGVKKIKETRKAI